MGEMKTIISANIPVSLAKDLKHKTKGTRSRVITRALTAYLADKEAFTLEDVPTRQMLAALLSREDVSVHLKSTALTELNTL